MIQKQRRLLDNSKKELFLNISKIVIICFVGFVLISSIEPFYDGIDSYTYGLAAINFSKGELDRTNTLLKETGDSHFAGERWIVTDFNTAVPRIPGVGMTFFGSIAYLIGGYYGLFYLTPIFTIALLITCERISSKLFGASVGLFTLLIVATSNLLFRNSINLQTESVFSVFFIIGCYCFIKNFKTKKDYWIFLSSCFFATMTAIRLQGIVILPIEIGIISFFIGYNILKKSNNQNVFSRNKIFKIVFFVSIPWILFIVGHTIFYNYYFGESFTNYLELTETKTYETSISSILILESKDFNNFLQYTKYLLPYQIPAIFDKTDNNLENIFGENWISIIAILLIIMSLISSLIQKKKIAEIAIFTLFIIVIVGFYSVVTSEDRASTGVPGRFMIPAFILSTMIFGYLLKEIIDKLKSKSQIKQMTRIFIIISISIFLIFAIFFSNPVQILMTGFNFNDPRSFAERYPLDMEGLSSNDLIFALQTDRVIDYGVIPFQPNSSNLGESFELLKETIMKDYQIYAFKDETYPGEKEILRQMILYDFKFIDVSDTFCKIEIKQDMEDSENIQVNSCL